MKTIAVFVCVFFSFAAVALGQVAMRTVTNADLDRFAQQRIEADRQYRETYASRGMLSPEELRARNDERIRDTIELGNQLRSDELERLRIALEAEAQELQAQEMRYQYQNSLPTYYPNDNTIYGYSDYGFYGDRRSERRSRDRRFPSVYGPGGYVSGGTLWPVLLGQPSIGWPQPAFGTGRRH